MGLVMEEVPVTLEVVAAPGLQARGIQLTIALLEATECITLLFQVQVIHFQLYSAVHTKPSLRLQ